MRQHRSAPCRSLEFLTACQIYLPDHKQFRSLKELLVVGEDSGEHRPSIELVSKYLELPMVSPSINQIYWQFHDLFDRLNCTRAVTPSHLFQTIHWMSDDRSNFHAYGDGKTVLTETGAEKLIHLYQHLESLIVKHVMDNQQTKATLYDAVVQKRHSTAPCGSREDWLWRFELTSPDVSRELRKLIGVDPRYENLPLLTSNRELITNANGRIVYACAEEKIIENLAKDSGKRCFLSPLLTRTCPLVLSALNIDYVERRGQVCWIHKNNNLEHVLDEVTEIFRETLHHPHIEVVTAKHASVTLWLSDLCLLNSKNEDPQENVDSYTFDSEFPFWIFDNMIFLNISSIRDDSRKSVIAISALATLLHKRQLISIEDAKSIAEQKFSKRISFSVNRTARIASTGPYYYSYIDLIFPMENLSIEISPMLSTSSFDTQPDSSPYRTPMIAIARTVDDCLYRDRVRQQDHRTLTLKNSKKSGDGKIVNHEEQIRIGDNAEHFFFRYLQKEYGVDYISPTANWCSSSRLKLFPGCSRDVDDTAGYDFFVHDRKEIFVKGCGPSTKRCYFEVKGIAGLFNVEQTRFHVSENERQTYKAIANDEQRKEREAYLLVIMEHCLDPEKIGLAALINWSDNFNLIHISPDSYICYIELPSAPAPNEPRQPSTNQKYVPPYRRNK